VGARACCHATKLSKQFVPPPHGGGGGGQNMCVCGCVVVCVCVVGGVGGGDLFS
jgi:hypothetical protein